MYRSVRFNISLSFNISISCYVLLYFWTNLTINFINISNRINQTNPKWKLCDIFGRNAKTSNSSILKCFKCSNFNTSANLSCMRWRRSQRNEMPCRASWQLFRYNTKRSLPRERHCVLFYFILLFKLSNKFAQNQIKSQMKKLKLGWKLRGNLALK